MPISPARRQTLEHERRDVAARCADCKSAPFTAFGDQLALRAWIIEHRSRLAAELRDYFCKNPELHARPERWFPLLTPQLRAEVVVAWERSELRAENGIALRPASLADASEALRAFIDDGFVALVCAQCRDACARAPETLARIRRRYAEWFFDGDLLVAQTTDPVRWKLLDDAIALRFEDLQSALEG
jgi:glutaredoxin